MKLFDIASQPIPHQLSFQNPTTSNGNRKLINGTFDWAYEEELASRDGFQWGPDSKHIAYWQIDANKIRDYYMMNLTDSAYSKLSLSNTLPSGKVHHQPALV